MTNAGRMSEVLRVPVIVAALGYFVDIYDLILFSIVRVPSLRALGIDGPDLLDRGVFLLNMQMGGMLLGGILWGVLGDKRGRVKILFGSIFLYSVANIANGLVETVGGYALWRFIAGIGLAGELGAGVTLVLESLPQQTRGYGTMIVASVGVTGAILANIVARQYDWRIAYFIGGGLGLALLLMRIGVYESGIYRQVAARDISKGNFFRLFSTRRTFMKYLQSILIGLPIWFAVGILITFSPEFSRELGVSGTITAGEAVMFCYLGLVFGDMASGFLSQFFGTRKRIVLLFQIFTGIAVTAYCMLRGASPALFYTVCAVIGFAVGYWAIFVTIAAEQFGTNLRATVASTVPNFIRGMVIPLTYVFRSASSRVGLINAAAIVGAACLGIALYALFHLEETYHKNLDFIE